MNTLRLPKITFWRSILIVIITLGLYATFRRFVFGLGDATNMTDQFPWGIWIGLDVISGVGLGAGGFVITAIVYIFNLILGRLILVELKTANSRFIDPVNRNSL